jgi:hypothetical protein
MSFRETEIELTKKHDYPLDFVYAVPNIEVGDNRDACELSRIFNQELKPCSYVEKEEGIGQQRGLDIPVRSAHMACLVPWNQHVRPQLALPVYLYNYFKANCMKL